jgi:hypothetical protein
MSDRRQVTIATLFAIGKVPAINNNPLIHSVKTYLFKLVVRR